MATSTTILCGICEAKHITKSANNWCPECEEGLCSDCQEHHSLSKASRKHQIISVSDYQKLPPFIAEVADTCKEHDMKFTHYCQQHDQVCCPGCSTTQHKTCTGVQLLLEVVQKSKTSAMLTELEERLGEMLSFIEQGIKNRKINITSLNKEQQNIKDDIKEIRRKINSHLDTLENTLLNKLDVCYSSSKSEVYFSVEQLSEQSDEVKELKNSLTAIGKYGSELQTFFGVRKINEEINKVVKYLKSTSEDKQFSQMRLVGKIDVKIMDILGLTSFGRVDVKASTTLRQYIPKDERSALVITQGNLATSKSIHDIKLELVSTFNLPGKDDMFCYGCTVCPDGKIICTNSWKNCLVFLNPNGSYIKDIVVPGVTGVRDVTVVDLDTVAVACNNGIKIIDVNTNTLKTSLTTDNEYFGVTYDKGSLLWCEVGKGIKTVKLSDMKFGTIIERNVSYDSFLAVYGDNIYFIDNHGKVVQCITRDGQQKWQFKDNSILSDPLCVTVDNNMFVYVTDYNQSNVAVISPDGKQSRQLLSSNDGLKKSTGISFDKTTNNLLVVNKDGKAFLYHIK